LVFPIIIKELKKSVLEGMQSHILSAFPSEKNQLAKVNNIYK